MSCYLSEYLDEMLFFQLTALKNGQYVKRVSSAGGISC